MGGKATTWTWLIGMLVFAGIQTGCDSPRTDVLAASPVALHGQLQVRGTQLVDQQGRPVQLRGMSSFWLNYNGSYANENSIAWLQQDWKISLFRAAMGVEAARGYLEDPEGMVAKMDQIVDICTRRGLYIIIDYHTHQANIDVEAAKRFFDRMSKPYGHLPNVIYEPWNEPEKVSWDARIKPYMEEITRVIRQNDPDNLILAGTPWWCQKVNEAAANPLDDPNTMYVLHFYAGSHQLETRDQAEEALGRGVPLFVSEFGLSHADGGRNHDREVYVEEANRWMQWMDRHMISWANWSLCDKDEASAALRPGAALDGAWIESELSESGAYIRSQLRTRSDPSARLAPL